MRLSEKWRNRIYAGGAVMFWASIYINWFVPAVGMGIVLLTIAIVDLIHVVEDATEEI